MLFHSTVRGYLSAATLVAASAMLLVGGCERDTPLRPGSGDVTRDGIGLVQPLGEPGQGCRDKAIGEIEFVWKGGQGQGGQGEGGGPDSTADRIGVVSFDVHEGDNDSLEIGEFNFQVMESDRTLHREIEVWVDEVVVEYEQHKAWFIGRVIADSKGCTAGEDGGHSGGCTGCGDEGGCDGHDTGHDGGCDGGDSGCEEDEGGCENGGPGDEGGCGEEEGGCEGGAEGGEGGCEGGDGGCEGGEGGAGGGGGCGGGGGHGVSGRTCRVGQVLVAKVHDGGTPGACCDGITWRWFDPDDPNLPVIEDIANWPHLCKKTIVEGNLMVHETICP